MKPLCLIQGPFATRSGYGDMARDIVRHVIELDLYQVVLISMGWGQTPLTALNSPEDDNVIQRILPPMPQLPKTPELFIQISVPNEFQPHGQYNIGITAGIETTLCSQEWIDGCNRMNAIFTISNHSKSVFDNTVIEQRDPAGNIVGHKKVSVPVEVLHNCVHLEKFHKIEQKDIPQPVKDMFLDVSEKFCFLFVGHWLNGNMGEDRKNVGLLIKLFCETFKNLSKANQPALLLKTSGAGFSIIDREQILDKIHQIRKSVISPSVPNVYLIHGELSEEEMNGLYNHPKVKAHISLTKGEGFGRPLLEASTSQKPIIASGWSGHMDFLAPDKALLIGGSLKNVDGSAVWPGVIIPESQWFAVDNNMAAGAMMTLFKRYDEFTERARLLAKENKEKFSYEVIKSQTKDLLTKYVPLFAQPMKLKLPELKIPEL